MGCDEIKHYSWFTALQQHTRMHVHAIKHWQSSEQGFGIQLPLPFFPKPVGRSSLTFICERGRVGNFSGCMKESERRGKAQSEHFKSFSYAEVRCFSLFSQHQQCSDNTNVCVRLCVCLPSCIFFFHLFLNRFFSISSGDRSGLLETINVE